jgi:hypothetical protein
MPRRRWSGSRRKTWESWRPKKERVLRGPLASAALRISLSLAAFRPALPVVSTHCVAESLQESLRLLRA